MKNTILWSLLLFNLIATKSKGQANMHITEQLLNGVIRIEAFTKNNTSTGTGFFFDFYQDAERKIPIPVIITNKHVVNGYENIKLFFKKAKNNEPDYSPPFVISIKNDSTTVIQHPEKNIDLVAIPIAGIINELEKRGIGIYYVATEESRIPSDSAQREDLKSIEDIWMIGYPNGLWDFQNNMPIVRKGITATTPYLDYNGKKEFLIDVAAFGGSSGSPVFFYRDIYTDKKTYQAKIGTKLYLLGILYAGPLYTVDGKIIKTNSTDSLLKTSQIISNIPMNLGYVIKASKILDFKDILLGKK